MKSFKKYNPPRLGTCWLLMGNKRLSTSNHEYLWSATNIWFRGKSIQRMESRCRSSHLKWKDQYSLEPCASQPSHQPVPQRPRIKPLPSSQPYEVRTTGCHWAHNGLLCTKVTYWGRNVTPNHGTMVHPSLQTHATATTLQTLSWTDPGRRYRLRWVNHLQVFRDIGNR